MRESRTLGLIVPNIESRFFASLAGSTEKRCREDGYALFITSSGGSADDDLELLRQLVTRGVDGVFWSWATSSPTTAPCAKKSATCPSRP